MDVRVEGRPPVQGREPRRTVSESGLDRTMNAYDARADVARAVRHNPNEQEEIRAFLTSKRGLIGGLPFLTDEERSEAITDFDERFGEF